MSLLWRRQSVLPGFGLAMGITVTYLSLLVLVPLSMIFLRTATLHPGEIWAVVTSPRSIASLQMSFSASLIAAGINAVFGVLVAWVLVRYSFPGKSIVDALVDLPFALPTAVGGIALTAIYAQQGWVGRYLYPLGIQSAFSRLGVVIALTFVGLPFVVRTVQPVMEELEVDQEEAAASLGAGRFVIFTRVLLPSLWPSILTGFAMSFARAFGEYGSVVFISGNMPFKTEITPLVIMTKLEQYDYAGATALAAVMLLSSFVLLFLINRLQAWSGARVSSRSPVEAPRTATAGAAGAGAAGGNAPGVVS
ncbi:sulfate/thiosulfate transporter subunit [Sorangium cellulosum]|uniref:Sulfate transport system permease protein CysT n=1 Tax=Sorangium cellulosum TaxID=56 RepID=A0A2L0EIT3_SORCE|nr:sulfate ABC transporter permease subunit CysT [Sorangium cellulosum]AUX39211.1 sulfate/thiosulfate transporter subunit [Sorangium cellulosum]